MFSFGLDIFLYRVFHPNLPVHSTYHEPVNLIETPCILSYFYSSQWKASFITRKLTAKLSETGKWISDPRPKMDWEESDCILYHIVMNNKAHQKANSKVKSI